MADKEITNEGAEIENPAPEVEGSEVVEETPDGEEPHVDTEAEGEEDPEGEETDPEAEGEEDPEAETEEEAPAFEASMKYKAGVFNKETGKWEQKDFDVDPKFKDFIKDEETQKLVHELHGRAHGVEMMRERVNELRTENTEIKNSINHVKKVYNGAVRSGNWHKLDDFFALLDIPQENILRYAIAKAELNEMEPAQRAAVLNQLEAERRTDALAQERETSVSEVAELQRQNVNLQTDFVLAKPEVAALVAEFDKRAQKPGAFKEAVFREGSLAWNAGETLSPAEAVQRVIQNYGLTTGTPAPAPASATPPSPGQPAKKVVQRSTTVIPNVGSRSASPLPSKPKNMEELLAYRKEQHGF